MHVTLRRSTIQIIDFHKQQTFILFVGLYNMIIWSCMQTWRYDCIFVYAWTCHVNSEVNIMITISLAITFWHNTIACLDITSTKRLNLRWLELRSNRATNYGEIFYLFACSHINFKKRSLNYSFWFLLILTKANDKTISRSRYANNNSLDILYI